MNYGELTTAISELRGDDVLNIVRQMINNNPDNISEEKFMSAVEEGVKRVVEKFEMREYTVGDLIYSKEVLSEIMDMTLSCVNEERIV